MEFPAYVPAAVRERITTLIEGVEDDFFWGDAKSLAEVEKQLAEIEETEKLITEQNRHLVVDDLPSLQKEKARLVEVRDAKSARIDTTRRLAYDERMRFVFASLTAEFTYDQQWLSFIDAALNARMEFSIYRDQVKRVLELKSKIARAGDELAQLIRQFAEIQRRDGPAEFYSIPELLRNTNSHEMTKPNLYKQLFILPVMLGRVTFSDFNNIEQRHQEGGQSYAPLDQAEEVRNGLRYGWLPDFPAMLDTVSRSARAYEPTVPKAVHAAIRSRQRSVKTEYIRAFGTLLLVQKVTLTKAVMQAMATVATVVINKRDIDVTYDDVKKALARLDGEELENSKE